MFDIPGKSADANGPIVQLQCDVRRRFSLRKLKAFGISNGRSRAFALPSIDWLNKVPSRRADVSLAEVTSISAPDGWRLRTADWAAN